MDTSTIITLCVFGVFLIAAILCFVFKKNFSSYNKLINPILKTLMEVLKAVNAMVPSNEILKTITFVISTAIDAAGHAEQLWLQGEIDKNNRPAAAQEYIITALTAAKIELTSSLSTIISGAIALTCYLMPHYSNKEE